MAKFLQVWKRIEESLSTREKVFSRRNSAECADLGDMDQFTEPSLFMDMLPREIHFLILSFVGPTDMRSVAMVNKDFQSLVGDDLLWKIMYTKRWLGPTSDTEFVSKYFPRDFEWREMYRKRTVVEKKYLHEMVEEMSRRNRPERTSWIDTNDWRSYLRKGKLLAKYTTEDLPEFLLLASIEQEQYKSAAVLAKYEKDKKETADIYYYWGRCIKDLSRNAVGNEKYKFLLDEQEKYQVAANIEPKDSYILYSWAINLRFQLEHVEGDLATAIYRESSQKYRIALRCGYLEKYVLWGLGSLKLHMAKKQIHANNFEASMLYLDKAEKKYSKLQRLWEEGDILTSFSLCFNYSCIYSTREKICRYYGQQADAATFRTKSIARIRECSTKAGYAEYLTLDLLDLWYFDEIRGEQWFKDIYAKSKPKKLSATW